MSHQNGKIEPINQKSYAQAKDLMNVLFDITDMLPLSQVNATPLTDLMQDVYANYILPVEYEKTNL